MTETDGPDRLTKIEKYRGGQKFFAVLTGLLCIIGLILAFSGLVTLAFGFTAATDAILTFTVKFIFFAVWPSHLLFLAFVKFEDWERALQEE